MTLEQVKAYTVGVLKGWFTNKRTLDKLSESDNGNLLYDGKEIKGGSSVVNGTAVTLLAEDAFAGKRDSRGYYIIPLSQDYTNFDELRVSVYKPNVWHTGNIQISLIKSMSSTQSLQIIANSNVNLQISPEEWITNQVLLSGPSESAAQNMLYKIEGIVWQEAKVGRKLYPIFDITEHTDSNAYIPTMTPDFSGTDGGPLNRQFEIQSIEGYSSVLVCMQADGANLNTYNFTQWVEVPVDFIKANYGTGLCTYDVGTTQFEVGWQDATHMGFYSLKQIGSWHGRVRMVYGIKYETVTETTEEVIDVTQAIADTVAELNTETT